MRIYVGVARGFTVFNLCSSCRSQGLQIPLVSSFLPPVSLRLPKNPLQTECVSCSSWGCSPVTRLEAC